MKLSRIYTNQDNIFPQIQFRQGLNVIFARVKDPTIKERDSHNLGKTFLANVLDFCLLAKIDKDHPFRAKQDLFGRFVFYLELMTNDGQHVTVRRKTFGSQSVSIHIAQTSARLDDLPDSDWTFPSLGLEKAETELNRILALNVIEPYGFRKGIRQFLRRQSDYSDEFRTSKFVAGKDKDWKPYIALMLGFDPAPLIDKYQLDEDIEDQSKYRKRIEAEVGAKDTEYDEIKGLIEIREAESAKIQDDLDKFSFHKLEAEINEDVVTRIERRTARLNEERYTIDYEIQEIDKSIGTEYEFDTDQVFSVFSDVGLVMPELLVHDYEQLVDFNRRLSGERDKRLRSLRESLLSRRADVQTELLQLDQERRRALAILREQESIVKYKELQRRFLQNEEQTLNMRQQLVQMDKVTELDRKIEDLRQQQVKTIQRVNELIRGDNQTYSAIRRAFAEFVQEILNVPALLSVVPNQNGNLEFKTRIIDQNWQGRETNESEGTSYKKLLCACFDLAVLNTYATRSFYRFVYHDGIFEGLDNRKKVKLLNLIRRFCSSTGIQYVLTVIDSDLPRDDQDDKLLFTEEEIVRALNDEGEQGRLFRMGKF